jgi:RNA polymerase sigma factor (sigma-70 family)
MAAGSETLAEYLRRLRIRHEADGATDAALLGRFISERDETAFAALVDRHGPLVFHVCRRVLGDVHDAEDALQAAFLVLARKATTVQPRESLAAWLHAVARRVALKARSARVRRLRLTPVRGPQPLAVLAADPRPDPLAEMSARELVAVVDEEVRRLPEVYRLPVILCCLEGRSLEEAARQLGWTPNSVKGRLQRGRARLHARLVRRGLTLSAALAAVELSRAPVPAALLAPLLAAAVRGAPAAADVSAEAVALAGEVARGLALVKPRVVACLLAACLLAVGFLLYKAAPALSTSPPQARAPSPSGSKATPLAAALVKDQPAAPEDPSAPIQVRGRVLGPGGKPFAGARLYVGYAGHRLGAGTPFRQTAYPLRATSGADGGFQFAFAEAELDARRLDDSRPAVVAVADGYGLDWAEIAQPGRGAALSLRLVEDLAVDGRILDQKRRPIVGATVFVRDVSSPSAEAMTRLLQGDARDWAPPRCRGLLPGQPPSVTTGADGRFRLTGLGRDRLVTLTVEGPALEHTLLSVVTRPPAVLPSSGNIQGAAFEYVTPAARPIQGMVRDKATGKPVAGVRMSVEWTRSTTRTDEEGRYELPGCPRLESYPIRAVPDSGQPYFAAAAKVPDRAGPDPLTVDFDLVSGIRLRGRVTDRATGRPPRAAVVEYYPLFPNSHSATLSNGFGLAASSDLLGPDGSYSLVVLPGPGVVCVAVSPRRSYAVARVDEQELATLVRDGINHARGHNPRTAVGPAGQDIVCVNQYHGLFLINPGARADLPALDLALRPARPLRGTVCGPDGRPLTGVTVVGLTAMPDEEVLDSPSFTVTGLNPQRPRELFFHHRDKALGKVLTLRGDETEPLTVPLAACGAVSGRLVDREGKPVPGMTVSFLRQNHGSGGASAVAETDRDGRFRVNLVPGQKYALWPLGARGLRKDVGPTEAESGRSKDLGELRLAD